MNAKIRVAVTSAILVAGVIAGANVAGAQAVHGVITGRVVECGPGPIVALPPTPAAAHLDVVSLYRNGALFRSVHVTIPGYMPRAGTFVFTVPPARYEIISSYQHRTTWVNLVAGARDVVNFNTLICPM